MGTYLIYFKNTISTVMAYRVRVIAAFVAEFVVFLAMFYLWSSLYREGAEIGSYTFGSLVSYYFLSSAIMFLMTSWDVAWVIGDEIRFGQVMQFLTRPVDHLIANFSQFAGCPDKFQRILPILLFISLRFAGVAREAFRMLRVKIAEINSRVSETIEGIRVVQLFRQG